MNAGELSTPTGPPSSPPPTVPPTPGQVLTWCASTQPQLWFPSEHARQQQISRELLDEPVWLLRQAGLIRVGDWVQGLGQGYALTAEGQHVIDQGVEPPVGPPEPAPVTDDALNPYDRGELIREAFLGPRPAIVVPLLLFALIGWFLVGVVIAWRWDVPLSSFVRQGDVKVLLRIGAAAGPEVSAGAVWRLITCGFVHIGGLHLLGNLFALVMLGPVAEGLWGRVRFTAVYLLSGFAAACAAVACHPNAVVAGASGSIWGLQLAVVAWLVRYREHLPAATLIEWVRRLAVVLAVNAVVSLTPGVSWEGHLAGGATGYFAALLFDLIRPETSPRRRTVGIVGILSLLALAAGGLNLAIHHDPDWAAIRARPAHKVVVETTTTLKVIPLSEVAVVRREATQALIARGPGSLSAVRIRVGRLRQDAGQLLAAAGTAPVEFRTYLAAVQEFASYVEGLCQTEKLPQPEQWKEMTRHWDRVEQTWQAIQPRG